MTTPGIPSKFFCIRLKERPEFYVPKRDVSYALHCDQYLEWRLDAEKRRGHQYKTLTEVALGQDNYWYVKADKANVYTSAQSVKRILSYCAGSSGTWPKVTFDTFEVVKVTEKGSEVISATDFYNNWKKYD
jgi:hypothetical protein